MSRAGGGGMKMPESSLMAAVERMSRALEQLSGAPSVTMVLDEVLRLAADSVGTDLASVTWRDATGALRTRTLPPLTEAAAATYTRRLLEEGALVPYLAASLEADAAQREALGAAALLAVPLPAPESRAEGVLAVYSRAPRAFAEEDVKRVGLYARLVQLALERERLLETARHAASQARAEAEHAEILRLARLQQVMEAFGRALTREEVARVTLELGVPAVGAASGTVHLSRADGPGVELMAARGLSPEHMEAFRRPPTDKLTPGAEALHTALPVWVVSPEEMRVRYPAFSEQLARTGHGAFAILPLRVDGDVFGVLSFGFASPRRFSALERASIAALARQCAQALERARLYDRERQARLEAEAAGRRLRLLADASELLSSSLDWEATVAGAARLALGPFADWCIVDALEEGTFRRLAVLHVDPAKAPHAERLRQLAPDPLALPSIAEVLRTGRSLLEVRVLEGVVTARSGDTRLESIAAELGLASFIIVPLVARQRTLGALSFVRGPRRPPYDAADLSLAEELAARAALAMDNARLLRQAREAEEESRRGAARLHVLAQVGQLVAEAGLNLDTVLDVITRKVSEALGDGCMLRLLSEDGEWLETVVVHHRDEAARALLQESARARPRKVGEGLVGKAIASGQTLFLPHVNLEELREGAPEYLEYVERYGPQSIMAVPLVAQGRALGGLLVVREAQGRAYSQEERLLLESLAARVALAIDDARLYGAATQAVRARDDLLSVAGHELKTPLNALQLQIHLLVRLAREGAAPGLVERAERAVRTSERLRLLLDDLLDVSRIRAGQLKLKREEVDLAALTREGVARMSEELARSGCEVRLLADVAAAGHWDRLRLEQVISNLLSNAAKYGAGHPVEVAVEADGERARLRVKDGGIGIAPEDQARIFERFERASGVGHIHGLGLGLWITRQIVEAHGGSIRVESAVGQGSTFVVELPLRA